MVGKKIPWFGISALKFLQTKMSFKILIEALWLYYETWMIWLFEILTYIPNIYTRSSIFHGKEGGGGQITKAQLKSQNIFPNMLNTYQLLIGVLLLCKGVNKTDSHRQLGLESSTPTTCEFGVRLTTWTFQPRAPRH